MRFRVQKSKKHQAWLVLQNCNDIIVAGFDKAKYAHRTKNFLNSGGAFDGFFPSFFCTEVEIFDGEPNVGKQESQ